MTDCVCEQTPPSLLDCLLSGMRHKTVQMMQYRYLEGQTPINIIHRIKKYCHPASPGNLLLEDGQQTMEEATGVLCVRTWSEADLPGVSVGRLH